jgi:hypothetical protein
MAVLSRPRSLLDALALALGAFGGVSGPYGLWDISRFQVDVCRACGVYPLPFAFSVPWYIAGDLFVTMTFAGVLLFLLAFVDLESPHEYVNIPEV